jgi:hypothetical protein
MNHHRLHRLRAALVGAGLVLLLGTWSTMIAQQISIPRIDQMSALPSPYLMRDWKQVARGYDSLVFNTSAQGQYLPLSRTYNATTNYPGIETFALQSYVGSSLSVGEGINCLPAIVGATLAGIDKSNQHGINWVAMCREWFNKANGRKAYFNTPGGGAQDDWWYETMPNVFFYQLYSQYPGTSDFAGQFVAVADQWLAALHVLGASTAPWSIANVNHQAFDLSAMKPVDGTWVEPEAAGVIAWLLYQAYVVTGDQRYREGAEQAMESLLVYATNPSYELQLPYGTVTAARMNAELGTSYDITKLLNWCFSNGDGTIRQWGVTVGTWGGLDCSGLIGEVNHTNDYPFFMNGVEQAGALAPVVRYDDRYARAIGKWLLHLANSSRLFYTNFLPDDHQDSYVWGHQYDPDAWIAHESLRQSMPSNSAITPYLTGDAIQGGWAPTNFALYGASHVGILAGLIDTTDVAMVLRIDVGKTDYFHDSAYPTYLLYNPYPADTAVTLQLGQASCDVYNTVTKLFMAQGVSGSVQITVPADGAVVAVVTPAGGAITYDLDRTLVNGVVIDYRSGRAVANYPPRIKGLATVTSPVIVGASTGLYCTAVDRDSDALGYAWNASAGSITGSGRVVQWTAPATAGSAVLQCTVSDRRGGQAVATDTVPVIERPNAAPEILRFNAVPRKLDLGAQSTIECVASDPDGDSLRYAWSDSAGTIVDSGRVVHWDAPGIAGDYAVSCVVSDAHAGSTSGTVRLEVRDLSIEQNGALVAYYPFNGNALDATGHGHDGAVNGAQLVPDRAGNPNSAYAFNGSTSAIVVPNDSALDFQKALTVNLWLVMKGSYTTREQYVISHGNWQDRWKLSISPGTNKLRLTFKNTQGLIRDLDAETPLELDTLYNVTGVYDGGEMELYLNGVLDAFTPFSGSINSTTTALTMGQDLPGDNNYNFNGILDDIRLYDYGLSLKAITALAITGIDGRGERGVPWTTALEQNYPNPFNPTTVIRGQWTEDSRIRLVVYDLLGREVAVLADGRYPAGKYAFTFDGMDLASGVYFYRLTTGMYSAVRKMVLVR